MPGLVFLIILLIFGVVVWAITQSRKRLMEAWAGAARELGMALSPGSAFRNPEIRGAVDQLDVKVDTYTQSSGNSSQTFTRYRVRYPSRGFDFKLTRQTGFSRITKFFGAQDVEVGDEFFDETFLIKSDTPERVGELLTPMVRTTLLRLAAGYPGVEIEDDKLTYSQRGAANDPAVITTTVRRLIGAAFVIAGLSGSTADLDAIITQRAQGDLRDAAQRLGDAVVAHRDDLETRLLEAETLAEVGEVAEAASRFERLAVELPSDVEVRGWNERLRSMTTGSSVGAPPEPIAEHLGLPDLPDHPAAPPSTTLVEAQALADDLFTGVALSFETSDRFDELYRGRPIRWTGTVKSMREFNYDSDLGDGPGTKAVVTVANIANDLYGQAAIDAVFGLPAGSGAGLARGDQVTFEGTLVRVDSMMRNVFVGNGRLV